MWRALRRLDTSPGQEKVIRNAWEEFRLVMKDARQRAQSARPELAQLIRGPVTADELNAWLNARVMELNQVTPAATEAFAKVHEVLDDRQRAMLADWVERSRGFHGHRHHSLHGGCC
jgi:hypothetical protein